MPKLSVSVPDELWDLVHRPDDQPSRVVQRALRLLAEQSPGASLRRPPSPEEAAAIALVADNLAGKARWFYDRGYDFGLHLSGVLPWIALEEFRATPSFDVESWLFQLDEKLGPDEESVSYDEWVEVLYEWARPIRRLDWATGMRMCFPTTFSAGVANALETVRLAVDERIRSWSATTASPADGSSEKEEAAR